MSFTSAEISTLEKIFGMGALDHENSTRLYSIYRVALMASPEITKQLKLRSFVECLYYKQTDIDEYMISQHRDLIVRFLKTYVDTLPSYVVPPYIFENKQLLSIWCEVLNNNSCLTHIQIECVAVKNTSEQQQFLQTLTTMPQLQGLTIVGFDFNQGRMQVLIEIMRHLIVLTALSIEDCKLDIDAGVSLASIVNTSKIHDLTLRRIIHDKTITLGNIINALESQALKFLRLDNNAIVETDWDLLFAIFSKQPQLGLINLENTHFGDIGVEKLTHSITANQLPALVTLCLVNNGITDVGARLLLQALRSIPSLLDTIMLGSSDHFYPENTPKQPYETPIDWAARLESRYGSGRIDQLSYFVSTDRAIPNEVSDELRGEFKTFFEAKAVAREACKSASTTMSLSEPVASTSSSSSTAYFAGPVPLFSGITMPSSSPSCSSTPVPGGR